MILLRGIWAATLITFWRFVAWDGGPNHHSYTHARWRIWQEQSLLSNFLEHGDEHKR